MSSHDSDVTGAAHCHRCGKHAARQRNSQDDRDATDEYELKPLRDDEAACNCHKLRNSLLDVGTKTIDVDRHGNKSSVGITSAQAALLLTVHTITNVLNYADRYLISGR